jgi:molecular chaperone GrpE
MEPDAEPEYDRDDLEPSAEDEPAAPLSLDVDSGAERVRALEAEVEELRGKWARAQADYQTLRRRGQAELDGVLRLRLRPLLLDLLLVLDYLDLALAAPAESADARKLAAGIGLTRAKLVAALEGQDVRAVPEGGPFDPELHEATATVPRSDVPPGTIVQTVRPGYTFGGDVLRHAHVIVAEEPRA